MKVNASATRTSSISEDSERNRDENRNRPGLQNQLQLLPTFINEFGRNASTCLSCGVEKGESPKDQIQNGDQDESLSLSRKIVKEICIKSLLPGVGVDVDIDLDPSFPFCEQCSTDDDSDISRLTHLYRQLLVIMDEFHELRSHVAKGIITTFVNVQTGEGDTEIMSKSRSKSRMERALFKHWKLSVGWPVLETNCTSSDDLDLDLDLDLSGSGSASEGELEKEGEFPLTPPPPRIKIEEMSYADSPLTLCQPQLQLSPVSETHTRSTSPPRSPAPIEEQPDSDSVLDVDLDVDVNVKPEPLDLDEYMELEDQDQDAWDLDQLEDESELFSISNPNYSSPAKSNSNATSSYGSPQIRIRRLSPKRRKTATTTTTTKKKSMRSKYGKVDVDDINGNGISATMAVSSRKQVLHRKRQDQKRLDSLESVRKSYQLKSQSQPQRKRRQLVRLEPPKPTDSKLAHKHKSGQTCIKCRVEGRPRRKNKIAYVYTQEDEDEDVPLNIRLEKRRKLLSTNAKKQDKAPEDPDQEMLGFEEFSNHTKNENESENRNDAQIARKVGPRVRVRVRKSRAKPKATASGGGDGDGGKDVDVDVRPKPRRKHRRTRPGAAPKPKPSTSTGTGERKPRVNIPRQCTVCGKILVSAFNLTMHMKTHNQEKAFPCPFPGCDMRFIRLESVKVHSVTHTGERPYECEVCHCRFLYKADVRSHKAYKHGLFDCEALFECLPCQMKFITQFDLGKHLRRPKCNNPTKHTNQIQAKEISGIGIFCVYCNLEIATSEVLTQHQLSAQHRAKKYEKVSEGKRKKAEEEAKAIASQLAEQGANVDPDGQGQGQGQVKVPVGVPCDICQEILPDLRLLNSHKIKFHVQKVPFVCEHCGKVFPTKKNLDVHSVIHSAVKPFSCSTCGREFNQKAQMLNHERKYHPEEQELGLTTVFKCPHCPREFQGEAFLDRHLVKAHPEHLNANGPNARPFYCKACFKTFPTVEETQEHFSTHGDVTCNVEGCDKVFSSPSVLRKHLKVVHIPGSKDNQAEIKRAKGRPRKNPESSDFNVNMPLVLGNHGQGHYSGPGNVNPPHPSLSLSPSSSSDDQSQSTGTGSTSGMNSSHNPNQHQHQSFQFPFLQAQGQSQPVDQGQGQGQDFPTVSMIGFQYK